MKDREEVTVGQLEAAVTQVRSDFERQDKRLFKNEQQTRNILIDPILVGLGWNVRDPNHVGLEVRANGNVIDYVLSKWNIDGHAVVAVVEAKAVTDWRASHRKQASGYAVEIGARYALFTNGLRWEAWEIRSGIARKNSMVAEVNVTTGEVKHIAQMLRCLSYDARWEHNSIGKGFHLASVQLA